MKNLILDPDQPLSDLARVEPYWYIATPYTKYQKGVQEAFEEACAAAAIMIRAGYRVFSPIAHTHSIAVYGEIPLADHNIWLPADRPFMDTAGGLVVVKMEGWDSSVGVLHEIDVFNKAKKPIEYLVPMG